MKAELINPFLKAGKDVFSQMAGIDLEIGKKVLKRSPIATKNVVILIGVTGALKGHTTINMDENMAMKVASNMMGGMPVFALDELCRSAISELGNMILGNAATHLYDRGCKIDITPPTLLTGNNITLSSAHIPAISVTLESSLGQIEVDVALKENIA